MAASVSAHERKPPKRKRQNNCLTAHAASLRLPRRHLRSSPMRRSPFQDSILLALTRVRLDIKPEPTPVLSKRAEFSQDNSQSQNP